MRYIKAKLYMLSAVAALLILSGCAVTDFDRTANFGTYKTFAWGDTSVKVENPAYESGLIHKNIRSTVESEFAKRGIGKDNVNPDFIVSYHTYTEQKTRPASRPYYGPAFYPLGFRPFIWGWGWGVPYFYGYPEQPYTYTEGTLIIDVTDATTDELVWRGTVAGRIDQLSTLQKQVRKGVKAIMKKYPVSPSDDLVLPDKAETA